MSNSIPQLKLFPLYPGGPVVQGRSGSLNANSSFYTRSTNYSSAYGVNQGASTSGLSSDSYLSIGPNQQLQANPISQAQNFDRLIGINGNAVGGLSSVSAPSTPPEIPSVYQDMVSLYSITDAQFSDLLNQPDFRIPNIGMGLKVTTDGAGGIAGVAIDPSSRAAIPSLSALSDAFAGPNRAEITTGATFKATPIDGLNGSASINASLPGANTIPPSSVGNANDTAPNANTTANPLANTANIATSSGIFKTTSPSLTERLLGVSAGELTTSALQQRLAQLKPPDPGLSVVGVDAQLSVDQSRQLATSQAGLQLDLGTEFRQNAAQLASAATQAQTSYAAAYRPMPMDRAMDGRIPMAPSLPAGTSMQSASSAGQSSLGFAMSAEVMDAQSRRGSGGYLPGPLTWQSRQENPTGTNMSFSQSGQQSGGAGLGTQTGMASGSQSGQQDLPRRRPMAFMA